MKQSNLIMTQIGQYTKLLNELTHQNFNQGWTSLSSRLLPTALARRVMIAILLLLIGVGDSVAQTVTFSTNAVTRDFYLNKSSQTSVDVDIISKISKICSDLSSVAVTEITPTTLSSSYVLFWGLGDGDGNVLESTSTVKVGSQQTLGQTGVDGLFTITSMTAASWETGAMKKYLSDDNNFSFISYNNCQGITINFSNPSNEDKKILGVTLSSPNSTPLSNYESTNSLIFALTYKSHTYDSWNPSFSTQEFDLKYIFHFGKDPNSFEGDWTEPEPEPVTFEVESNTSTSAQLDFSSMVTDLSGVKYARFFLTKDGEPSDLSATAITVSSGQTVATDASLGVYLYTGSAFDNNTDLNVTVSIPSSADGTIEDYRLVAYFSDDDPQAYSGTTVTKEPATLDAKKIYKFNYPITKKDKYIAWSTNSTTLDITSYISADLATLTNSSTTGYISWALYDGSYGETTTSAVTVAGNSWSGSSWSMYQNNGNNMGYTQDSKTKFEISDTQLSSYWSAFTNPVLKAPGTDTFESYKDYVLVCELSDVSSDKIRVRYIFHFNADGLPPYELVNETDIAATKMAVPTTDYEVATKVFDVSDALVSGAKYARIYVAKYGNANAESENLIITYDGNPITQCATGNEKYGWYLSESGGIDPSKLSITGLDADEMLKYELVIVSSTNELSGTQEPAWEKKTVYYLQKDIRNRVMASSSSSKLENINYQADILSKLAASVSDFSKSLYAKWYILDPTDSKVAIGPASEGNTVWRFDMRNYYSVEKWTLDGREYKYFTDNADRTSTIIESTEGWEAQIAKVSQLFVLGNDEKKTADYIGYKIVFEFSDEYDTSTGAEPAYKLKYTTVIVDPNAFTGTLSETGVADGKTVEVTRNAASVDVDLTNGAFAHSKLSSTDLKYARFYLADVNGNLVNPDGKLVVKYDGADANVTACTNTEEGFYIYLGLDGSTIQTLDKSKISVQLTTPKAYKLYKVVGVFSTAMTEMIPEDGSTPLTREPDWELNYSYNFTYPTATTNEIPRTMEWRRNEMKADASTTDVDTDWNTSFEELSLGQCIKWYVVNGSGEKQPLVIGDSRQSETWSIDMGTPFAVESNVAILKGDHAITDGKWNSNWGKPAIYAPAGVNFEDVQDYKIICEVAAENDDTATPNVKYVFSMYKSYLGELKESGSEDHEMTVVDDLSTSEAVSLGTALTKWGGSAKYARVWLTTADGAAIDPTGKLTVTGMTPFTTAGNTDVKFGYYVSNEGGISLSDATLAVEEGTFDRYQVHVALSTDLPGTTECDYDYLYTFGFKYDMKTKYKTVLYDETTRQCTPHLLGNWQELAVDCHEGRTNLAASLYVRWYLEDKNGTPIAIDDLTSSQPYTSLDGTTGYYRYGFDSSQLTNKGDGTAYNPTITLPSSVTDCKDVRVVCVVSTKTDTWNEPWTADPEEMQVKYVYSLRTADDLDPTTYPFVHYRGEGYRYVAEQGLTEMASKRDYIEVSGTTVDTQYSWNSNTNTYEVSANKDIRQNVHTVDYYYYLNLNEGDEEELLLPLQYYSGGGNDTEPRGYFRWYNFNTDKKSADLVAIGDKLTERDYGHVALPFGEHPCSGRVGVKFKAPVGFTSLSESQEIQIACDVSRYMDGMDDSFTYLVHEPTISERYIFHILPASILAAKTKAKAANLAAVETQLLTKHETDIPSILEYSGRIVVSTNNGTGKFSLRTKIRDLKHYYLYDASDNVVAADYMQWYAYYKDDTGSWWKGVINMGDRRNQRQANYTLSDISGATWTKLSGTGTTAPTIGVDDRVVMVATVGNTSAGADKELPIIWGELEIIDAKPMTLGNETEERTVGYMNAQYNHANTLDFNDFFLIGKKKPENSFENYAKIPIEWANAQYGFCYPQLYGLCATNKYAEWGVYGVSPLHGDYILLKSMNINGISKDEDRDGQSILCQWWDTTPLYDVTHERVSNKAFGDTEDYGAFLYVDAADEARTIAELEFDAALCPNARLYYSAYVADITNGATKPQVRFRVSVDDNGERVPVVSFVTGDIQEEVGGSIAEGLWYQVYGHTTIPAEMSTYLDGTLQHFYVEIDNYCDNTNGADYCIDQISFYTQSAQVQVKQLGSPCDEGAGVEVKIVAPADKLLASLGGKNTGTKKVFYRLFKKHDDMNQPLLDIADEEVYGPGVYSGGDDESNIRYATVWVNTNYDEATLPTGELPEGETQGYYKGDDGIVYYQFDDRFFPLEVNSTYFVSFYTMGAQEVVGFTGWGNPYSGSVCSTYSNYITPNVLRIDLESGGETSDGVIPLGCGVDDVEKTFNITVQYPTDDGYVPYTVKFDFYQGSKAEFKAITNEGGDLYLERALEHFREKYPNYVYTDGALPTEYDENYTAAMHDLIVQYMGTETGKLTLLATTQFNHHFFASEAGEVKFAAIPVDRNVEAGRYICSPLEFVFDVQGNAGAPVLELGFGDVTYPTGYDKRVVRVGLEQLKKMKTGGYKLHIPVARYQNKGSVLNGKKLYFTNTEMKVSATNDPTVTVDTKVADIFDPSGGTNRKDAYVSTNRMYLPLDFSQCAVDFHEGYYYEVSTSYLDEDDDESNPCASDLYIVFKVVPEFVTWDAQQIGTSSLYSGNWYDDKNWQRSTRAELYKDDATAHSQNTASAGHPAEDLYKNNEEINALLDERPGFVPMKFTYVTLLGNNHSPSMINENYGGKITGTPQMGGDMINPVNDLASDTSPSVGSSAYLDDKFIRYDMLVRYGTHANGGEGCFGHQTMSSSGGSWGWNAFDASSFTAIDKCYDVEKFYGNICKEIYFKPGAELRLQQRLTYEKAWVEKELVPNKWYLMSTPLKGTYAGDMYVPATAMTDYSLATPATVTGRQVTEAFQPITFDKTKGYSRTQYPIYQRSWGLQNSKVYTKTDDIRATDYSAYLKFSNVSSNLLEWSHTYNDVQVPYTGYSGFAIRANRKDGLTDNTLIRLPKTDTSYEYFDWTDNASDPAAGTSVKTVTKGETAYGRLVYDNQGGGLTSADLEQWSIPLTNLQAQGTDEDGYTYYLVGNPFMASIDMGKFFGYQDGGTYYSYNPKLDPVYYTYEAGVVTAVDARTTAEVIRPLQAFIVKCKASDAPENIVFNRWAITDGNYTPATVYVPEGGGTNGTRSMNKITLRASNGNGASEITLRISEDASVGYDSSEDVTTLFDFNLSEVPMAFTVAGQHAVSIDTRPSMDMVLFGVACAASDEPVEVTVENSHLSPLTSHLYILDAVTGETKEIDEGSALMVQPNDYGRYFLTTHSDLTSIHNASATGSLIVSVRNRQLTVRSASELTSVRVLTAGGETVQNLTGCGNEVVFNLPAGGIYIIEAQTENDRKTLKVITK